MASGNMSPSEVKSIVNGLECSPSKSQASSPIRNGGGGKGSPMKAKAPGYSGKGGLKREKASKG